MRKRARGRGSFPSCTPSGAWGELERKDRQANEQAVEQASLAIAAGNRQVQKARNQAELVLGAFLCAIGWQVTIR